MAPNMGTPELRSMTVEIGEGGQVLLVLTLSEALVPAVIGFDPADAHRLGKTLLEAAKDARAMKGALVA